MRRAGEHLLTLINDLLDLASVEAGKLAIDNRETQLPVVIRDVAEIIGMRASSSGIEFGWRIASDTPEEVSIDDRRLRQNPPATSIPASTPPR